VSPSCLRQRISMHRSGQRSSVNPRKPERSEGFGAPGMGAEWKVSAMFDTS
jgi:hypothetical protein